MNKRKIGIVIIVLLAIAAFMVWRTYFRKAGEEGVLLLSGNMEVTETNVGFKIAGRVTELSVDEGQQVQTGQVLARLDNAELASTVTQNRAALQEAASHLAELKAGSRPQEIEQARANVRSEEAEEVRLKKDYERAETLYTNGAISTAQFDAAKSAYETQGRPAAQRNGIIEPREGGAEKRGHRCGRVPRGTGEGRGEDRRREAQGHGHRGPGSGRHTAKERRAWGDRGGGHPYLHHRRPLEPVDKSLRAGRRN